MRRYWKKLDKLGKLELVLSLVLMVVQFVRVLKLKLGM